MTPGPADEYTARAAARRATLAERESRQQQISSLRLLVFAAGVLLALLAWRGTLAGAWLLLPLAAFVVLVVRHDRTIRTRDAAARAVAFYERGLARIEDRWAGGGEAGDRFQDERHPYTNDLDIFGHGSLFELLSIARTRAGEETLAAWLQAPAGPEEIRARQDAVRELTGALDLREALTLSGADVRAGVHTAELVAWAEAPPRLRTRVGRGGAVLLTSATLVSLVYLGLTGEYLPLLAAVALQASVRARQHKAIAEVLHGAQLPARDLIILFDLLGHLERQEFESERLRELRVRIAPGGIAASTVIGRLQRLVEAHDWEHNIVFAPVAAVLMWSTHLAWAIEEWRRRHGGHIGGWLRAAGEVEALSSLAAYRYEHPADPFPDVVEPASGGGGPVATARGRVALFESTKLGHPLLPASRMVSNDVSLTPDTRLIVVSGSNMSGKSTLLRTVGVNAVLALAGAPVRAASLRLTPLAIGATLRIQDSLIAGRSRFFAEITRIREIVDLARGPRAVLFLLDELFHGTNSHDRRVGAAGVLHRLIELGASGFVTTHDLALTGIAAEIGSRARNVHFEDRFEHGEMVFDYRIKPGPVRHSNALALMRAVGLEIDTTDPAEAGHDERSG